RGVKDQSERMVFVGEPNGSENILGVIYINVADYRNPQDVDAFLTMDQDDHPASSLFLQCADRPFTQSFQSPAFNNRCNEKKNHQNSDQTPPGKDPIQQTFQSIHETTSFHLAEPAFMSSSVC